ncbi:MAG: hypothetical protein U0625_04520 [Phycisphaerales bacterium]
MTTALSAYDTELESLAHSDSEKTAATIDALERDYRIYLSGSPEHESSLSESERNALIRARDRVARGEPAFSAEDPFCISRMNRRYHESRQALYRGEATARFALVDRLADCATPRIDKVELERLRSRLTVEASNRGVDDRKFYGSIDPGLLVSFDLYELLEQSKPLQKSLAPSSKPILAIRDLDPATSPVVAVAAQRAILRFDSDAGQAIDSWIRAITARNAANELTYAAADQELKACDQIVGNLIRRRWELVLEIAALLRANGFEGQATTWEIEAGRALFPSAFEAGQSDQIMVSILASEASNTDRFRSLRERFDTFEQLRTEARTRLIAAMVSGAGVNGRRGEAASRQVNDIRAEILSLDSACASELAALRKQ